MEEETEQRAYEIVEELRADIDFELDDVISRIVRGLPEDYFTTLSRQDQLTQLKALLAMGICNLKEEIMLRYDNGRNIAVVSRQNYPGLLANILKRLPKDAMMVRAKIFTSIESDFIIDLFEFKSENLGDVDQPIRHPEVEQTIEEVAQATGRNIDQIRKFVSHYHLGNRILRSPKEVTEQFLAFDGIDHSNDIVVRWIEVPGAPQTRVTISAKRAEARDVFQMTAEFLAGRGLDIHQAYLHDIPVDANSRIAIASFLVSGSLDENGTLEAAATKLADFLRVGK
jgi:hypothetical protein